MKTPIGLQTDPINDTAPIPVIKQEGDWKLWTKAVIEVTRALEKGSDRDRYGMAGNQWFIATAADYIERHYSIEFLSDELDCLLATDDAIRFTSGRVVDAYKNFCKYGSVLFIGVHDVDLNDAVTMYLIDNGAEFVEVSRGAPVPTDEEIDGIRDYLNDQV